MNIITCTESIRKFLIALRLILLLTKPQLNHLASFLSAGVQGGFDGKINNIPELSMHNIHRTSTGKFLSRSPWPTSLVLNSYQLYALARITKLSRETGSLIYVILDDTIAEKTKPSSKAKRPIAGCGFHYSHLKKKRVYGHQIVCVLLECAGVRLPYCMELYDKKKQSKIKMVIHVIRTLPDLPETVCVLGDSWYSANTVIQAALSRKWRYIGALKTNRILYTAGGSSLGQPIKRFLLLIMLVHAYCNSLSDSEKVTLGNSRKLARMEIKREMVSRIYEQTCQGIALSRIHQELGIN